MCGRARARRACAPNAPGPRRGDAHRARDERGDDAGHEVGRVVHELDKDEREGHRRVRSARNKRSRTDERKDALVELLAARVGGGRTERATECAADADRRDEEAVRHDAPCACVRTAAWPCARVQAESEAEARAVTVVRWTPRRRLGVRSVRGAAAAPSRASAHAPNAAPYAAHAAPEKRLCPAVKSISAVARGGAKSSVPSGLKNGGDPASSPPAPASARRATPVSPSALRPAFPTAATLAAQPMSRAYLRTISGALSASKRSHGHESASDQKQAAVAPPTSVASHSLCQRAVSQLRSRGRARARIGQRRSLTRRARGVQASASTCVAHRMHACGSAGPAEQWRNTDNRPKVGEGQVWNVPLPPTQVVHRDGQRIPADACGAAQ